MYSALATDQPKVSYAWLTKTWANVRSPAAGKPWPRTSTLRMFKRGDDFLIKYNGGIDVAIIKPDDTMEILCDPTTIVTAATHLDIVVYRISKGKYRGHHMHGRRSKKHEYNGIRYTDWEWHRENDPQL